jgi:hypothetical protein
MASREFKELQLARDMAFLREQGMLKKAYEEGKLEAKLEAKLKEKLRITLEVLNTTQLERSKVLKIVELTEEEFQAGLKELGWSER